MWMGQSTPVVISMSNYSVNDIYEMRRLCKVITIDFYFCFCLGPLPPLAPLEDRGVGATQYVYMQIYLL